MSDTNYQEYLKKVMGTLDMATLAVEGYEASFLHILETIDADQIEVARHKNFFLEGYNEKIEGENGKKLATLFMAWRSEKAPSSVAILMFAAEILNLEKDDPSFKAAIMAAIAADTYRNNSYHNMHHFREVLTIALKYCITHDQMALEGRVKHLTGRNVSKILLAAVSHDINHDGTNNFENGAHEPYQLEQKAIETIMPFMQAALMTQKDIDDVKVSIYTTDTSHAHGAFSPHMYLKEIGHAVETGAYIDTDHIPLELQSLALDYEQLQIAMIVSDADLAPSAGTTYEFHLEMIKKLRGEDPNILENAKTTAYFCEEIMKGGFTSPSAKAYSQSAFEMIIKAPSC